MILFFPLELGPACAVHIRKKRMKNTMGTWEWGQSHNRVKKVLDVLLQYEKGCPEITSAAFLLFYVHYLIEDVFFTVFEVNYCNQ